MIRPSYAVRVYFPDAGRATNVATGPGPLGFSRARRLAVRFSETGRPATATRATSPR